MQFLDGDVRLIELWECRKLEGERRDPSEGEARLIVPGVNRVPVNWGSSFHNPVYILSLSGPKVNVSAMAQRFGRFLVRLQHADQLARSLYERLASQGLDGRTLLFGDRRVVAYTKDDAVRRTPPDARRLQLTWCQKPAIPFADEHEYRLAFGLSGGRGDAPTHISVRARVAGALEALD